MAIQQLGDREEFAGAVKAALEARQLGVREVARRSNGRISTTSVLNMLGGHLPNSDVIIEFAEAVTVQEEARERQVLADQLLSLAGKRARYAEPARVRRGLLAERRPAASSPADRELVAA